MITGITDPYEKEPRKRSGSPLFYELLEELAATHEIKSHDYASDDNPAGNYHFAGKLSKLFDNPDDSGFLGRIGEKIYRLANLENNGKSARNETVADTEKDICVITCLWMSDRRERRLKAKPPEPTGSMAYQEIVKLVPRLNITQKELLLGALESERGRGEWE